MIIAQDEFLCHGPLFMARWQSMLSNLLLSYQHGMKVIPSGSYILRFFDTPTLVCP